MSNFNLLKQLLKKIKIAIKIKVKTNIKKFCYILKNMI